MSKQNEQEKTGLPLVSDHDEDPEQFRLRSREEIGRVLRDLIRHNELITAYYSGSDFLLTTVLGVDMDKARIYVDVSTDESVNRRFAASDHLVFVGRHFQVRLQFTAPGATLTRFEGGPAFAVPFPDSMLRMQRREFYRLITPLVHRPQCHFTTDDGRSIDVPILDISLGGIGIIEPDADRDALWAPGNVIRNCQVDLPEGCVMSDVEVRNRYTVALPGGKSQLRVGCRFLHLEPRMNSELQRYIHRIELERRRLSRE
ncbi:MAG: flagellar brake protein [Thiohalomonadaceae bacterium]